MKVENLLQGVYLCSQKEMCLMHSNTNTHTKQKRIVERQKTVT